MANGFDPDSSWISVMCRASRFQITVLLDDLRGSSFEHEYTQLVAEAGDLGNPDDDGYDALCSWIVERCFACFRNCTPHVQKDLTFQAFYYPPTYHLRLVVSGPTLYPEVTQNCHTINPFVLMTPSRLLPQFPHVSHLKGSEVQIVTHVGDEYDYMSEIPRKAIVSDVTVRFFKPSLDESQVIREIDVQSRILSAGLKGKIRVANVHSIVISDDAMKTIGLLFDLEPSVVESLDSFQCKTATEHHAKWKQQVTDIITELHSHDLVWGDVHPGNIFIDKNFDAWPVRRKATGKGSGESLTNGFLEMKTPDDTVALLVRARDHVSMGVHKGVMSLRPRRRDYSNSSVCKQ
ncbi:hypothetical protein V497_05114 [Pseudogymnoascus sp. VKM F-4516 (FW-969)]|nr:hypothetical protein V497_05114 [Pseudogymnoascus sp. VKM F-4516 (FW-969)]